MKKYCILLLFLALAACSPTPKDKVDLFNGLSLKLYAGESLQNVNPAIHEFYLSLFDSKHYNIPIFKWIKGGDYSMFVGILYNDSIVPFIRSEIIGKPAINISTDSVAYGFIKSLSDDRYIAKYISKQGGNNLFIAAVTSSSIVADSLFTYKKFKSRLQIK